MRGEAVLREGRAGPSCLGQAALCGESEESADCSSGTLKLTRHSCRKQEGGREVGEALRGACRCSHGLGCVAAVDSERGP